MMELQPPAAVLTAVILTVIYSSAAEMAGVRLVDGNHECSGTPEVLYEGEWRRVDSRTFNYRNAKVVCRELDCGNAVNVTFRGDFRNWEENETVIMITCTGKEPAVSQCDQKNIWNKFNLSTDVICSDSVRLVDGAGLCSGRVEVKLHQSWTTVCETGFDWQDAEVVCRELGCGRPLTLQGALFGEGKHLFGTKEFQCKGTENRLLTCSTSDSEGYTCPWGSAVGLTCSEPNDVRLVDGGSRCAGTVEIFHGGEWRRVKKVYWDMRQATVVCRQLDCGSVVTATGRESERDETEWSVEIQCQLSEHAARECLIWNDFQSNVYATVACSDSVRLVGGAGLCSGRVEVKSHQSWTTVCEADFDWQDAEVVCRELDCGTPLTLQGALFGEGKLPFGAKKFQCNGTENRLLTCGMSDREEHTCTHDKAVGLTCSGPHYVSLVDESSHCAGTVMLYSREWKKVGADRWSMREAAVVCRQLDCGSAVAATQRESKRNGTELNSVVDCEGFEFELRKCSIHSGSSVGFSAGVICSGLLVQPSISFSFPTRVSRGHQGPEVFQGYSFTITCSTQPQYPGGSFRLKLPWNNRSQTQTAVNHSASFLFPAADDSHQGKYSCVYENQVIFQNGKFKVEGYDDWSPGPVIYNFSSESEPLSLIITESPLPAFITRMLLVPFLMLMTCLSIFLIFKKWGHFFIRNTSGQQGAAAAAVQYENIKLVSLQSRAEEQQNVERGAGEELLTDLEQKEEEEQNRN